MFDLWTRRSRRLSCLVVIDCFDFFRHGAGSGCTVIGVKSAEGVKERGNFFQVDAETIFSPFDIPGVAEAERSISSAELAVIVGNQPLKSF